MPWPQNSRTTEKPSLSAKAWIAVPDVAEARARPDLLDAAPHRLIGELAQALGGDRTFADDEHAAGVAVPAVLDDGDVDVDDVAVLQRPLVRDAVADLVVDRGADRLRVGHVARAGVVQRRRYGLLDVHDVVVREASSASVVIPGLTCGSACPAPRTPAARRCACRGVCGGLDGDRHGADYVCGRGLAPSLRGAGRVGDAGTRTDCLTRPVKSTASRPGGHRASGSFATT